MGPGWAPVAGTPFEYSVTWPSPSAVHCRVPTARQLSARPVSRDRKQCSLAASESAERRQLRVADIWNLRRGVWRSHGFRSSRRTAQGRFRYFLVDVQASVADDFWRSHTRVSIVSATNLGSSCSQNLSTSQPAVLSSQSCRRSRSTFAASFSSHQDRLTCGLNAAGCTELRRLAPIVQGSLGAVRLVQQRICASTPVHERASRTPGANVVTWSYHAGFRTSKMSPHR